MTLAEAVLPALVFADVTALVTLFFNPPVAPVTFTEKMQEPTAGNCAPAKLTEPDPAVAVMMPPPHEPVKPFGVPTTRPAGKGSVSPIPLNGAPVLGLVTVKLRVVVAPRSRVDAPKALLTAGGLSVNVSGTLLAVAPAANDTVILPGFPGAIELTTVPG